jgi:hypothetical protein
MQSKTNHDGPEQDGKGDSAKTESGDHAARPVRNPVERAFASLKKAASDRTDAGKSGRNRPRRASPPTPGSADEGE